MKMIFILILTSISLHLSAKEFHIVKKSKVNEEIDVLKQTTKSCENFVIYDVELDDADEGYAKIIYDYQLRRF